MLEINSNGSKWYGQEPDSIEELIKVLGEYPLDPTFEKYGNFIDPAPEFIKPEAREKYAGCTSFFGNFYTYSHVFNIITDDPEVIEILSNAIRVNLNTKEYKQARKEYKANQKAAELAKREYMKKLRRAM